MSPAPWKLSETDADGLTIVSHDSTALIAQFHGTVGLEQNQANARLGVLAPEMLDLIRDVAGALNENSDTARDAWREKIQHARALLARTEG